MAEFKIILNLLLVFCNHSKRRGVRNIIKPVRQSSGFFVFCLSSRPEIFRLNHYTGQVLICNRFALRKCKRTARIRNPEVEKMRLHGLNGNKLQSENSKKLIKGLKGPYIRPSVLTNFVVSNFR